MNKKNTTKKQKQNNPFTLMTDEEFEAIEYRRRQYQKLMVMPSPKNLSHEDSLFISEKRIPGSSEVKFYSPERIEKLERLLNERQPK